MKLHSINDAQRLYVIQYPTYVGTYGFEYLDRKARGVAEWIRTPGKAIPQAVADRLPNPYEWPAPGTRAHFKYCMRILDAGARYAALTGERCPAELDPRLIGMEGCRVESTAPDGTRARFIVGKSSGWLPCHLQLPRRDSRAGGPVYLPPGATVRMVERVR